MWCWWCSLDRPIAAREWGSGSQRRRGDTGTQSWLRWKSSRFRWGIGSAGCWETRGHRGNRSPGGSLGNRLRLKCLAWSSTCPRGTLNRPRIELANTNPGYSSSRTQRMRGRTTTESMRRTLTSQWALASLPGRRHMPTGWRLWYLAGTCLRDTAHTRGLRWGSKNLRGTARMKTYSDRGNSSGRTQRRRCRRCSWSLGPMLNSGGRTGTRQFPSKSTYSLGTRNRLRPPPAQLCPQGTECRRRWCWPLFGCCGSRPRTCGRKAARLRSGRCRSCPESRECKRSADFFSSSGSGN
jgi:hypothetical protein